MIRFSILFLLLLRIAVQAQSFVSPSQIEAFNITVNYSDYTVKTQILKEGKKIKTQNDLIYLWYKSNQIIETSGGFDGRLLHGYFKSFYLNNQLKEQGELKYGLKNKEWKYWYSNGQLKEIINWRDGRKSGVYMLYNENGRLMAKSTFKKDKLNGKFFTYDITGKVIDTKEYKNGDEVAISAKQNKKSKKSSENNNDSLEKEKGSTEKKTKGIFKRKTQDPNKSNNTEKSQTTTT
ncbi:MAG: hypothetical protein JNK50_00990 [Bacteroidia bacterium]|nr:hypothetical protein [Bacteroidia bacterium]